MTRTPKNPKNLHFDGLFLIKAYNQGAALGTLGTVSTVPDFFDQDELFYHFILFKFNSEAYFSHLSPFASI